MAWCACFMFEGRPAATGSADAACRGGFRKGVQLETGRPRLMPSALVTAPANGTCGAADRRANQQVAAGYGRDRCTPACAD